ncbi:AI-2E family transporter [bacterium]|nr:AI-2E family transporter [bacterium]
MEKISHHERIDLISKSLGIIFKLICLLAIAVSAGVLLDSLVCPLIAALFFNVLATKFYYFLRKRFGLSQKKTLFLLLSGSVLLFGLCVLFFVTWFSALVEDYVSYEQSLNELYQIAYRALQSVGVSESSIREFEAKNAIGLASVLSGSVFRSISEFLLFFLFIVFTRLPTRMMRRSERIRVIASKLSRFFVAKALVSGVTAMAIFIFLKSFGHNFASFFALGAFVLNFIPNFGSIFATLLPLPITLIQFGHSTALFTSIFVGTALIQFFIGNIVEPKISSVAVRMSPLRILLYLGVFGLMWGPFGLFFAVPIGIVLDELFFQNPSVRLLFGELLVDLELALGQKQP